MRQRRHLTMILCCAMLPLTSGAARAQGIAARLAAGWYVSWGYNTENYAATDIRFRQSSLGNDFTLHGARMHDRAIWDLFNHSLTIPQYSVRIGHFIRRNTAIELNFDHAKAVMAPDQNVRLSGMLAGTTMDQVVRVGDYVQTYKLNNGANFLLFNLVQRWPLLGEPGHTGSVALLGKVGVGFMYPHTENTVLGQPNRKGFEFGGFGTGVEAALRVHFFRGLYVEGAQKGFYGRYRNLNINGGSASHDLWAHVTIISLGIAMGHPGQ